jgi:hypothetical protein
LTDQAVDDHLARIAAALEAIERRLAPVESAARLVVQTVDGGGTGPRRSSQLVEMRFIPDNEAAVLSGRKTATARRTKHGEPGDYFEVAQPGPDNMVILTRFVLESVERMTISSAARVHHDELGADDPAGFYKAWERAYGRIADPDDLVFLHRFRRA